MPSHTSRPADLLTKIAAISMLLLLSACAASPFRANVNRFQQLPPPQGETFVINSLDPNKQGGIEFSQYAAMVEQEMVNAGYVSTRDPANADLVVSFDYDVDNGREKVRSYGPYTYGGFGYYGGPGYYYWPRYYHYRRYAYGFYDPFIYGGGYGYGYGGVDSYTVYASNLRLSITRKSDNQRLFEGTAMAQSRSNNLQYLVPNLVEALFTGFPGNSGETVRISISPEEKTVKTISMR